jgi:hypothetical protein
VSDMTGNGPGEVLTISPETVCRIAMRSREFDAKVAATVDDPGSNDADEGEVRVLTDYPGDATYQELATAISDLNEDEQLDLVALAWLGRGDYTDWYEARAQAGAITDRHLPDYLTGMPLLSTYLEDALAQLGFSCADYGVEAT